MRTLEERIAEDIEAFGYSDRLDEIRKTDASFTYTHMNLKFLWLLGTVQLNRKLAKRLMGKRSPERVKRGQQKRKQLGRVPYFPIHI